MRSQRRLSRQPAHRPQRHWPEPRRFAFGSETAWPAGAAGTTRAGLQGGGGPAAGLLQGNWPASTAGKRRLRCTTLIVVKALMTSPKLANCSAPLRFADELTIVITDAIAFDAD
jgi:hypothetical protein